MDDLVQFLRARLDEDEQAAWAAASKRGGGTWEAVLGDDFRSSVDGRYHEGELGYPSRPVIIDPDDHETSVHIARHDPARVLAEVDAKRRLLADVLAEPHFRNEEDHWYTCAASTDQDGEPLCSDDGRAPGPCDCGRDQSVTRRVRLLALPYADHPDYRDDWRP